jgi:hypothetical protein
VLKPRNVLTSQEQQKQQLGAGPIIGPTMMIMMVLPVLSLTVARDRDRRPAISLTT